MKQKKRKMQLWLGLAVLILGILMALIKEILEFSRISPEPRKGTLYVKKCTPSLIDEIMAQIQSERLYNYDAHYKYAYVPEKMPLASWCAKIGEEVKKTTGAKFTMITGIYYFQCKHSRPCISLKFQGPPTRHFKVVLPTKTPAMLYTENKSSILTREVVGVATCKHVEITCAEFLLVIVEPFLAWDL
jgi:hypothetical protein